MNVHDAPHRRLGDPCCGAARLHARNSERCATAQRSRRSSAELREVAKYGPPSAGSGMLPLEGSGTYSARQRVVTRYGGARPPGPPSLASHVIPTSAARKPIALRREPTISRPPAGLGQPFGQWGRPGRHGSASFSQSGLIPRLSTPHLLSVR